MTFCLMRPAALTAANAKNNRHVEANAGLLVLGGTLRGLMVNPHGGREWWGGEGGL